MKWWDQPYGKWSEWRLEWKIQWKVDSLTYMLVKIIYLPWQVSGHGFENRKKSRVHQNVPENIPIWALPSIQVMQLKIDWKNKHNKFLQKISISGHKYTCYLIFGSLLLVDLEKRALAKKPLSSKQEQSVVKFHQTSQVSS